jgi:NAD-dependent glycerol-3-phosphate dehydrogenase
VADADVIILCAPHQFVRGICKQLVGKVKPGAIAVSLIKGMRVRTDGPQLISQMVTRSLGIDCSVLMGANIAKGIADKELSEATIGYNDIEHGRLLKKLFQREYFGITLVRDVAGAEMCGTLKNIVALGAGMVDGLGLGSNTKAAILRAGLDEMRRFSKLTFPSINDGTFLESCGMADLIATCYGGRNRLVALEYTKAFLAGNKTTFAALEDSLLNGQKLQGVLTSNEVQEILELRGWEKVRGGGTARDPAGRMRGRRGTVRAVPPRHPQPVRTHVVQLPAVTRCETRPCPARPAGLPALHHDQRDRQRQAAAGRGRALHGELGSQGHQGRQAGAAVRAEEARARGPHVHDGRRADDEQELSTRRERARAWQQLSTR